MSDTKRLRAIEQQQRTVLARRLPQLLDGRLQAGREGVGAGGDDAGARVDGTGHGLDGVLAISGGQVAHRDPQPALQVAPDIDVVGMLKSLAHNDVVAGLPVDRVGNDVQAFRNVFDDGDLIGRCIDQSGISVSNRLNGAEHGRLVAADLSMIQKGVDGLAHRSGQRGTARHIQVSHSRQTGEQCAGLIGRACLGHDGKSLLVLG